MRRGLVTGIAVTVVAAGTIGYFVFKPEPFKVADYDRMCKSPQAFSEAAPYQGAAPHPIEIVNGGLSLSESDPELGVWFPTDPAAVQLVGCVNRVDRGAFVKRCEYSQSAPAGPGETTPAGPVVQTIDLYQGIYTVVVYEARSGKTLAESRVEGNGFTGNVDKEEDDPCQPFLRGKTTGHSEQEGTPTSSQLRKTLGPQVHRAG